MSLYAGESVIQYTFGSQAFGTPICQVFESGADDTPGANPSKLVSKCVVSGSSVTLTMASTSADFFVQITGMTAWAAGASQKVSGSVTNFGTSVQDAAASDK